jgi:hypothetical protein
MGLPVCFRLRVMGLSRLAGLSEVTMVGEAGNHCSVSAGAKIPIVPIEFSPPLDVVNRSPLHTEEVPRLVKGERRARTKGTTTARDEYSGDQRADRLGPQDDSQVYEGGGVVPEYGPRAAQPSKLDAFKPYLEERLRAGVWNARVLWRELRERKSRFTPSNWCPSTSSPCPPSASRSSTCFWYWPMIGVVFCTSM